MSWEQRLGRVIAKKTNEIITALELAETDHFIEMWNTTLRVFDLKDIKPSPEFFESYAKFLRENDTSMSFIKHFVQFFAEEIKERFLEKMIDD